MHEIQFGHLRRPNHRSRQYDADRFEVANQKWSALVEEGRGFAVLNDCKYGLNVLGNTIALTLLRAPKGPDMEADQGPQRFTYAFYVWNGSLAESGVVREAYDLNHPAVTAEGAGGTRSLFQVDAPTVVIESVKPAEDGTGHVIVRLYESKRVTAVVRPVHDVAGQARMGHGPAGEPDRRVAAGRERRPAGFPPVRDQNRAAGPVTAEGKRRNSGARSPKQPRCAYFIRRIRTSMSFSPASSRDNSARSVSP